MIRLALSPKVLYEEEGGWTGEWCLWKRKNCESSR